MKLQILFPNIQEKIDRCIEIFLMLMDFKPEKFSAHTAH